MIENCLSLTFRVVSGSDNSDNLIRIPIINIKTNRVRLNGNETSNFTELSVGGIQMTLMNGDSTVEIYWNSVVDATNPINLGGIWLNPSFLVSVNTWHISGVNPQIAITTFQSAFSYCDKLVAVPNELPPNTTCLSNMFYKATLFNQNLNSWDTSNVRSMRGMFLACNAFNGDISNWNTSNVTDMAEMFNSAISFNTNIQNWNTTNVTNISFMFYNAIAFNQPINTNGESWNTSNVQDMSNTFQYASNFNQNIEDWNTSSVYDFSFIFDNATTFNQSINKWSSQSETFIHFMFNAAKNYNQNLNNFISTKQLSMSNILSGTAMSVDNYSSLLISLSSRTDISENIIFGADGLRYNSTAVDARNRLINGFNWQFIGDLPENLIDLNAKNFDDDYYKHKQNYMYDDYNTYLQHKACMNIFEKVAKKYEEMHQNISQNTTNVTSEQNTSDLINYSNFNLSLYNNTIAVGDCNSCSYSITLINNNNNKTVVFLKGAAPVCGGKHATTILFKLLGAAIFLGGCFAVVNFSASDFRGNMNRLCEKIFDRALQPGLAPVEVIGIAFGTAVAIAVWGVSFTPVTMPFKLSLISSSISVSFSIYDLTRGVNCRKIVMLVLSSAQLLYAIKSQTQKILNEMRRVPAKCNSKKILNAIGKNMIGLLVAVLVATVDCNRLMNAVTAFIRGATRVIISIGAEIGNLILSFPSVIAELSSSVIRRIAGYGVRFYRLITVERIRLETEVSAILLNTSAPVYHRFRRISGKVLQYSSKVGNECLKIADALPLS